MTDADDESEEGELAVDKNPSKTDVPYGSGSEDAEFEDPEPKEGASNAEPEQTTDAVTEDSAPTEDVNEPRDVEVGVDERTTAPQSAYSNRQALIGGAITLVGLVVVFGVPLVL